MRFALVALLALCGTAHAAMISGQVTGITTYAPQPNIPAGLPFRFEFSLNTAVPANQLDADTFNFFFEIYIEGNTYLHQIPGMIILPGPNVPYQHDYYGLITEDTLGVHYALGADDLFNVAFTMPGQFDDPLQDYPLANLTLESITGVSINFIKVGFTPIVSWFAINAPVLPVPEPSTYLLGVMGLVGLLAFRCRR